MAQPKNLKKTMEAKTGKQPECPSTDEWIKRCSMYNAYTMECYSAIKKNEILPYATLIDHVGIMLSGISQMEKDEYHIISLIHGI